MDCDRLVVTANARPEIQDGARDHEAHPSHEKGRDGFDGESDSEVSRSPDEINGRERGDDPSPRDAAVVHVSCLIVFSFR